MNITREQYEADMRKAQAEAWELGKFHSGLESDWTDADGDCPDEWVARNPYTQE